MKFGYTLVDLSHVLDANIPSWDGGCGFNKIISTDYQVRPGQTAFRVERLEMVSGIGTHIDAPAHCIPGSTTVEHIPLRKLVAPCYCIDIPSATSEYIITHHDIEQFELQHGTIPADSFVMIRTGWSRYWNNPEQYRNNHQFPSLSDEAARVLVQRNIVGLGIDTLSPDIPAHGFLVHQRLLSAGIYIIENVAHPEQLPATGSFVLAAPLNIHAGTEAPARLIGLIPQ